jgi:hypothetical protein
MNLNYDKASIELPLSWKAKTPVFALVGLVCILFGAVCFFMAPSQDADRSQAFKYLAHSYLANFMFILTPALGALFFILVQFLTRAGWSTSIRRLAEIIMMLIPNLAVLFLPIIGLLYWNSSDLYEWNAKEAGNSVIALKTGEYLFKDFFTFRALVYFGIWIFTATWYFRLSRAQDESGDAELSLTRQKWAGPLIMLFALSASFAAFDWVMSIDADWYSTIFGVYMFAGSMLGFFATMVVLAMTLQNAGKLEKWVTVEHYHDMGKFMFGFVMFWSYIAFSQLVLIWYANMPEETIWYDVRIFTNWKYLSYGLIGIHFAVPFLGLLSRHVRRHRIGLLFWAIWILVAHWLDLTFLVMPNVPNPSGALLFPMIGHFFGGIGMVCIFVALFLVRSAGVPLVAMRDPRLHEAMKYANPIL